MNTGHILVMEDDPSIQLGLRMSLERAGHSVTVTEDGREGLESLRAGNIDLAIVDVMMPHVNGFEVLRTIREERIDVPVLVLSAKTGEGDKVMGLDLGAEDYITKPFSVPELLARVRVALRRAHRRKETAAEPEITAFTVGALTLDTRTREVTLEGDAVDLTATEFDILALLIEAGGAAISRSDIFEGVWGEGHHGTHRTIDNFIAQLRTKLEDHPRSPTRLITVRGVGYRLVAGD